MKKITILLIDNNEIYREKLAVELGKNGCHIAASLNHDEYERVQPAAAHVSLITVKLTRPATLHTVRKARMAHPATRIIILGFSDRLSGDEFKDCNIEEVMFQTNNNFSDILAAVRNAYQLKSGYRLIQRLKKRNNKKGNLYKH